jgi:hypothetical protein
MTAKALMRLILLAALCPPALAAAQAVRPAYDPLQTFAPLTLPAPVSGYRAGDGAPGPDYWQNRADYQLDAHLDPAAHQLAGDEVITYTNNSPTALGFLWIQLDQNIYRRDARSAAFGGRPRTQFTDGFVLDQVQVDVAGKPATALYLVTDTRMRLTLPQPVKAKGGQVKLRIRYHYAVPGAFGGRTAWAPSQNGEIFDIAQWYPRLAVYDDLRGWDTLPYIGNEFYLEYGSFDYAVTLPADMIVAGSGQLKNPKDVLSPAQQTRLAQARAGDATVMIRTADEAAAEAKAPPAVTTKTWRFHMDSTRDVAFAASRAFVWDAARINLPAGKTAIAMSFYPAETGGATAWGRSTEYLKHAVEEFSRRWSPYPWPAAVNVAGPVGAMEYPGMLFDSTSDKGKTLFFLTAHEIGHTWFPMVVGFDERRDAWMDEGFNTFIDVYESDAFNGGEYGPKRDSEYAEGGGNPVDAILPILNDPDAPVILSRADAVREKYRHPVPYFKSALGLVLLREQILGPERFDPAFRKFIADWSYRHPSPSDFFRAMESAGGEDLSWFWRGWYLNNWTLDLAVQKAEYVGGDARKGAVITVANLGQLVMPSSVRIDLQDGTSRTVPLPVETWLQRGVYAMTVDTASPIRAVTVDPAHVLPDSDRSNNELKVTN